MVDLADGRTLIAGVGSFGNRICVENSVGGRDPSLAERAGPGIPADLVSTNSAVSSEDMVPKSTLDRS
jgi:hypothetical protein